MNKNITKKILEDHFRYFTFSLFEYPEKYQPLIFKKDAIIPKHVAYLCPLITFHIPPIVGMIIHKTVIARSAKPLCVCRDAAISN
jgi:hypothetical protein